MTKAPTNRLEDDLDTILGHPRYDRTELTDVRSRSVWAACLGLAGAVACSFAVTLLTSLVTGNEVAGAVLMVVGAACLVTALFLYTPEGRDYSNVSRQARDWERGELAPDDGVRVYVLADPTRGRIRYAVERPGGVRPTRVSKQVNDPTAAVGVASRLARIGYPVTAYPDGSYSADSRNGVDPRPLARLLATVIRNNGRTKR